ncbi:MAG: hypothetical protein HY905_23090 [Deltaproteobacteria bacterium]|nr:hypothetical protein [Deltaproteobacteria bacterium]
MRGSEAGPGEIIGDERRASAASQRVAAVTLAALTAVLACALAVPPAPVEAGAPVFSSPPPAPSGPGDHSTPTPEIAASVGPSPDAALVPPSSRRLPRPEGFPTPSSAPPGRIERPPQRVS